MKLFIILLAVFIYSSIQQLILPPLESTSESSDKHYALLIIPAQQIHPNNYMQFAESLQSQSPYPLWIGVASLFFDLPNQFTIGPAIRGLFKEMVQKGMDLQKTTIFAAGHSAGGSYLSEYLHDQASNDHLIEKIKGMILIGSYIKRVYYKSQLRIPVLTIQGDLDGVTRISRIAESMYHLVKNQDDLSHHPYVIIQGLNHGQIASGKMPHYIATRDFRSDIKDDVARKQMSEAICEFMYAHVDQSLLNSLYDKALKSFDMLTPIVNALQLEGNYHLKPPCYQASKGEDCWQESPWTRDVANTVMADLDSQYQLNLKDILWPAARVLPHDYLPVVEGKCTDQTATCHLNITSVTENIYEKKDKMDTSQSGVSAFEMRAKIAARQKFWEAAGIDGASNFNKTDGGNICAEINQKAIDWAEANADPDVLKRYKSQGQQLVIGDDEGPYNEGPLWIWIDLDYKEEDSSNGKKQMVVKSPMMKTPTNYWIWLSAGFHFCKLLSPARAMEWIYYDSLKATRSYELTEQ